MWGRAVRSILVLAGERPCPGLCPGFLGGGDLRLTRAGIGDATVEVARRGGFDLIVVDLGDPLRDGLDLCTRLKSDPLTRATPLVVVATAADDGAARRVGAQAVVGKPIVQREYHEAIGRFVPLPTRRVARHLVNLRFSYAAEGVAAQAFSRDLSLCGAFLKTDRRPDAGSVLHVQFTIPGEVEPVRCDAIVRRTAAYDPQREQPAGFAIEFQGIGEGDLERLERFLDRQARRPPFVLRGAG